MAILAEDANFAEILSLDFAGKLLENIEINNYLINLVDGHLLLYKLFYSSKLVELKTLKIYIETNLANDSIRPSKSFTDTLILFIQKSDSSFQLYINYQGFNNFTINN